MKRLSFASTAASASLAVLAFTSFTAITASAQEAPAPPATSASAAPTFGSEGTFVVTGESTIGAQHRVIEGGDSSTQIAFSPGFDYFVARNVSIGAALDAGYFDSRYQGGQGSLTTFGASLRVGANVPLDDQQHFSLYPRLSIGADLSHASASFQSDPSSASSAAVETSGSASLLTATLFAPILYHPVRHAFVGIGPYASAELVHESGANVQPPLQVVGGVKLVVGGWWGGDGSNDVPSAEAAPSTPTPAEQFDSRGNVVLTSELGLDLNVYSTGQLPAGDSITIAPSFDYFVTDHITLGLGALIERQHTSGVDGAFTSYGLVPRIGAAFAVGDRVTLWPQLKVGVGASGEDGLITAWPLLGAEMPILFHVAPHFVLGASPFVRTDFQSSNVTTFGASLVVGAWL